MKRFLSVSALVMLLFCVSSCDFFRMVAGRPTSKAIEAKRVQLEEEEQSRQLADSMAYLAVLSEIRDSIARADSLAQAEEEARALALDDATVTPPAMVINVSTMVKKLPQLKGRYYVIVGTFSTEEKLNATVKSIESAGYEAQTISVFRNTMTAVCVCPSKSLREVSEAYKKVIKEKFCPKDAYILAIQ